MLRYDRWGRGLPTRPSGCPGECCCVAAAMIETGPGIWYHGDRIDAPKWWNWQTRTTQNRVGESPCGFNSHLRHQVMGALRALFGFGSHGREPAPASRYRYDETVANHIAAQRMRKEISGHWGMKRDSPSIYPRSLPGSVVAHFRGQSGMPRSTRPGCSVCSHV